MRSYECKSLPCGRNNNSLLNLNQARTVHLLQSMSPIVLDRPLVRPPPRAPPFSPAGSRFFPRDKKYKVGLPGSSRVRAR